MGKPKRYKAEAGTIELEKVVAVEPEDDSDPDQSLEDQDKVSVLLASGKSVEVEGEEVPELISALDDYLEEKV